MPMVFVSGCFDVLHIGHIRLLEWASDFGSVFVAINSDASVERLKGAGRPVHSQHERSEMLLALRAVSDVFVFDDDSPAEIMAVLNPEIVIVGYDHSTEDKHYRDAAEVGRAVKQAPHFSGISTTSIIERLKR